MSSTLDPLTDLLANSLFDGAYRATGYILGPQQLKAFVRSFAEVTVEHIALKTGKTPAGKDAASSAQSWATIESEIGLYKPGHTEVAPSSDGFETTYTDCIFAEACGTVLADLIAQGVMDREDLPCMRCSLTSAAVQKATGAKSKYKMIQHAPGFRCRCSVNTL